MKLEKGITQVYTGEGKGKTTAACGLAIRAAGQNLKVGFFQFFKKPFSGEIKILKNIENVEVRNFLTSYSVFQHFTKGELERFKKNFAREWEEACRLIKKKKFDVVVLDEILIAVKDHFLSEEKLIKLIEEKPHNMELILTGRYISGKILEKADLVTEMKLIKHPFPKIKARKGIEY